MDCFKFNIYDLNINENYLYPALGFCGLAITYLGNKFIKPTLFLGGTIVSSTGSYKLTEFVLNEIKGVKPMVYDLIPRSEEIQGQYRTYDYKKSRTAAVFLEPIRVFTKEAEDEA